MYTAVLTANESSNMGNALFHFWYLDNRFNLQSIAPGLTGCPHNGGQHTMTIRSENKDEVMGFLEFFKEVHLKVNAEINLMLDAFNDGEKHVKFITLANKKAPYMLWQRAPTNGVFSPTGESYSYSELIPINFKARREFMLRGNPSETLSDYLIKALQETAEKL